MPGSTDTPDPGSGEPQPTQPASYLERLTPSAAAWLLAPAAGLVAALALWPVHPLVGLIAAVAGVAGVGGLLWATAPRVELHAGSLRAGTARIDVGDLGPPQALDRVAFTEQMGPELDPRAFVCHRFWVRTGVRIPVSDAQDPTPYWLIASRSPRDLADAVIAAQAAHSEQTG